MPGVGAEGGKLIPTPPHPSPHTNMLLLLAALVTLGALRALAAPPPPPRRCPLGLAPLPGAEGERGGCGDRDECRSTPPLCHHMCLNHHGGFACHCHPGFRLAPDGATCLRRQSHVQEGSHKALHDEMQEAAWRRRRMMTRRRMRPSPPWDRQGRTAGTSEASHEDSHKSLHEETPEGVRMGMRRDVVGWVAAGTCEVWHEGLHEEAQEVACRRRRRPSPQREGRWRMVGTGEGSRMRPPRQGGGMRRDEKGWAVAGTRETLHEGLQEEMHEER